ncbi:transposase [Streptomyces sp. NBC_01789]|uniref:transposase n=1 Tax=Streptomyces sp. NBC_01789 TaxID=2975941 RepID=UPI00224DBFB2|nr:transposase [Streptomyces sp. NBC_01789]MCX4451702.1 transposase [Streptomyces sp. NBC_01789]
MSDAEWDRLLPCLEVSNGRCGRCRDHRQVIDGILHRVLTGAQWRDSPDSVAADKNYRNRPCRECLRHRSIPSTFLEKTDSQAARLRNASRGGRPASMRTATWRATPATNLKLRHSANGWYARARSTTSAAVDSCMSLGQKIRSET